MSGLTPLTGIPRYQSTNTMISEVQVQPVKPVDGLIAFASVLLDGQLYLSSMAVYRRLDNTGYRITYPAKRIGGRQLNVYHPITRELGELIEQAITAKCVEIFEGSDEHNGGYDETEAFTRTIQNK